MKINKFAFILLGAFSLQVEHAHALEEVIVTSSIIDKSSSDISDPVHILSGEDIATGATQSLGETIDELLGVSVSDYGAAVGQPIIRGMSGSRVKILDNGIVLCKLVMAIDPNAIDDKKINKSQSLNTF